MKYDTIIIGAGLSGMAAGIRLAHYGKKVCILEKHDRVGGLNSFFSRQGRNFDVGLHAMTNFTTREKRRSPLNKLLRQLRISREELELCEHHESAIRFPECTLRFSNDIELLRSQVAEHFPAEINGFDRMLATIGEYTPGHPTGSDQTANSFFKHYLRDPQLIEMLREPVMYYGNPTPNDMALDPFFTLFQAIFLEGFCKPRNGIRTLLDILKRRLTESGGELRLKAEVEQLYHDNGIVKQIRLADGSSLQADTVISCAGYPETMNLTSPSAPCDTPAGDMAFVESLFVLQNPESLSIPESAIVFHNNRETFKFSPPEDFIDQSSATVCFPDNFEGFATTPGETTVRITRIANFAKWFALDRKAYKRAKTKLETVQLQLVEDYVPGARNAVVLHDTFTPVTIHRYTGRINGAIYGAPIKHFDGRTPLKNLFVCGSDQGLVGITGSILSGISMVNQHLL